jgi:hypothetical protein
MNRKSWRILNPPSLLMDKKTLSEHWFEVNWVNLKYVAIQFRFYICVHEGSNACKNFIKVVYCFNFVSHQGYVMFNLHLLFVFTEIELLVLTLRELHILSNKLLIKDILILPRVEYAIVSELSTVINLSCEALGGNNFCERNKTISLCIIDFDFGDINVTMTDDVHF